MKQSVQESLVQILTPKRRVDILRDVLEAQRAGRPYTITFCGVNGVGKSTNLAKVPCTEMVMIKNFGHNYLELGSCKAYTVG